MGDDLSFYYFVENIKFILFLNGKFYLMMIGKFPLNYFLARKIFYRILCGNWHIIACKNHTGITFTER